jgi:hypothetical protein
MSRSRQALADSTESKGFRITLNVVCMQQKKIQLYSFGHLINDNMAI